jgi:hypothetical protein
MGWALGTAMTSCLVSHKERSLRHVLVLVLVYGLPSLTISCTAHLLQYLHLGALSSRHCMQHTHMWPPFTPCLLCVYLLRNHMRLLLLPAHCRHTWSSASPCCSRWPGTFQHLRATQPATQPLAPTMPCCSFPLQLSSCRSSGR